MAAFAFFAPKWEYFTSAKYSHLLFVSHGCISILKKTKNLMLLGNRQQGTGNREQGTGNREQGKEVWL
ncbi:MAG: hypothetical protein SXA11_00785 [Cyanobacteriota bacterium]|nr:hypothetical protein [Cyanobacteriota bacterium]